MAVSSVTKNRASVPGKAKQTTSIVTLSGTYTAGGESVTAKEVGLRRITKANPSVLLVGNGSETVPVTSVWVEIESNTKLKIRLINGKKSAELAAGETVANVKVELHITGY